MAHLSALASAFLRRFYGDPSAKFRVSPDGKVYGWITLAADPEPTKLYLGRVAVVEEVAHIAANRERLASEARYA